MFKRVVLLNIFILVIISCNKGTATPDSSEKIKYSNKAWSTGRGSSALTGFIDFDLGDNPEIIWSLDTDMEFASPSVIYDRILYTNSMDGEVTAYNIHTGEIIWQIFLDESFEASPLAVESALYLGGTGGKLFSIDRISGKLNWSIENIGAVRGGANSYMINGAESIVFGSYDTKLYCVSAEDGSLNWSYESENYINGIPSVSNSNEIFFGGCDSKLRKLNGSTGELIFEYDLGSYLPASPAFSSNISYAGSYSGLLSAIDIDGNLLWDYQSNRNNPFNSSPAANHDYIAIGSRDRYIHLINIINGNAVWTFETGGGIDTSPVISENEVMAVSSDGFFYIIDIKRGEEKFSFESGEGTISASNGIVIITNYDGKIWALKGR